LGKQGYQRAHKVQYCLRQDIHILNHYQFTKYVCGPWSTQWDCQPPNHEMIMELPKECPRQITTKQRNWYQAYVQTLFSRICVLPNIPYLSKRIIWVKAYMNKNNISYYGNDAFQLAEWKRKDKNFKGQARGNHISSCWKHYLPQDGRININLYGIVKQNPI
jgi:hypothetical protein